MMPETAKSEVEKLMYADVANFFGKTYAGFRPKKTKEALSGPELSEDNYSGNEESGDGGLLEWYNKNHEYMRTITSRV